MTSRQGRHHKRSTLVFPHPMYCKAMCSSRTWRAGATRARRAPRQCRPSCRRPCRGRPRARSRDSARAGPALPICVATTSCVSSTSRVIPIASKGPRSGRRGTLTLPVLAATTAEPASAECRYGWHIQARRSSVYQCKEYMCTAQRVQLTNLRRKLSEQMVSQSSQRGHSCT